MRAILLALAALLLPINAYAQPGHWDVRMAMVELSAAQVGHNRTLLLGDSNTEAFYWNTFDNGNCLLVNAGFGGARIQDIAIRAPEIFAYTAPRNAHVMVGTNNLYISTSSQEWAQIPARLHEISLAVAATNTRLIWWPVPPMAQAGAPADYMAKRAALNAAIQAEAGATGALWDWWFWNQFTDGPNVAGVVTAGYATAGSMRGDGVHFAAATQTARHSRLTTWSQQPGVGCP